MKFPHTIAYSASNPAIVVYGLGVVIVCMGILYMYLLASTVVHVVMQKEVERKVAEAETVVSELETELMLAQHKVSAEIATLEGYVEPETRVFIDRGEASLVVRDTVAP
jgi:hypothetical protein